MTEKSKLFLAIFGPPNFCLYILCYINLNTLILSEHGPSISLGCGTRFKFQAKGIPHWVASLKEKGWVRSSLKIQTSHMVLRSIDATTLPLIFNNAIADVHVKK